MIPIEKQKELLLRYSWRVCRYYEKHPALLSEKDHAELFEKAVEVYKRFPIHEKYILSILIEEFENYDESFEPDMEISPHLLS